MRPKLPIIGALATTNADDDESFLIFDSWQRQQDKPLLLVGLSSSSSSHAGHDGNGVRSFWLSGFRFHAVSVHCALSAPTFNFQMVSKISDALVFKISRYHMDFFRHFTLYAATSLLMAMAENNSHPTMAA
jgi:MYND finger